MQIAALQQQLMVAALTCDDVSLYNSFVIAYQKDLVASDQALQAFFDRFGNEEGMPAYHSFKTKMANLYSARSASDKKKFCASARASFAPALKAQKMSLASFAMSQPSMVNEPYTNCGDTVAGGAMVAGAPVATPAPAPSNLLTAQNAAQEAKGAAVASAASAPPAADTPLSVGVRVNTPAPSGTAPAAGSAAGASAAAANSAAPPSGQTANPNATQERSPYYQGYGVGYARERERSAQQQREQAKGSGAAPGAASGEGVTNAPSSSGQTANTYQNQQRSVTRSASEAYRERLAQQRAARERAAQRPAVRYRDRYDARGYFWPADPYWQYCYTRYGVRMSCAEAAQRYRSNQFYYRAPYDAWGFFPSR